MTDCSDERCDMRLDAHVYGPYGFITCGACDPWCQKCPFLDVCLREEACPQSDMCNDLRYGAYQLDFEQMPEDWQDMTKEPWYKDWFTKGWVIIDE